MNSTSAPSLVPVVLRPQATSGAASVHGRPQPGPCSARPAGRRLRLRRPADRRTAAERGAGATTYPFSGIRVLIALSAARPGAVPRAGSEASRP
jgi:hypothetical protein